VDDPQTDYLLGATAGGDSGPVGICQVRYRPSIWTGSDDAWLEDIYVDEAARGTGIGRALIEAAFDRARERGCGRIELDVFERNPARRLYDATGFSTKHSSQMGDTLVLQRKLP
jgi:GNAT superfamily N-acetyltransferase